MSAMPPDSLSDPRVRRHQARHYRACWRHPFDCGAPGEYVLAHGGHSTRKGPVGRAFMPSVMCQSGPWIKVAKKPQYAHRDRHPSAPSPPRADDAEGRQRTDQNEGAPCQSEHHAVASAPASAAPLSHGVHYLAMRSCTIEGRVRVNQGQRQGAGAEDPLFVTTGRRRITHRVVTKAVKRMARGLGQNLHPHMFSHSYATELLDRGADLRVIRDLLGHESVATTEIYRHVSAARQ